MRTLIRNVAIILAVLAVSVASIIPPSEKLRLGKDLRGGTTLVYAVQLKSSDRASEVIPQTIEVIKKRINPDGLQDITIVQQGQDRIEITMALPTEEVKNLRRAFEAELEKVDASAIDPGAFERAMERKPEDREAEVQRLAAGDPAREKLVREALAAYDEAAAARAAYEQAKAAGADDAALALLVDKAGDAADRYDRSRGEILRVGAAHRDEVWRILRLKDEDRRIIDSQTGAVEVLPSPRKRAEDRFKKENPEAWPAYERARAAYETYLAKRTAFDDPEDLKRMMRGAGVLDFRIAVNPGQHPQEERLRRELREHGPANVRATDAHWYKVNKIDTWYSRTEELRQLLDDPRAFFSQFHKNVGEEYDGEYYILCWDIEGKRLTREEAVVRGEWKVDRAYPGTDKFGKPAIDFQMDTRGASLLHELTKGNVGEQMAVLLDDQVYTAPTLNEAIGKNGQISGEFSAEELRYVIQVLAAGSLQAKLSPEPLSQDTLGPELGLDNLRYGLKTAVVCFIIVAVFMVIYYFSCGGIAVFALAINFLLVLAIMSLARAPFTVPGIAGIVLTFGQAIDSNVLIYERMREEFLRGADMKTAVRLGFSRASSSIIDGNVANLIICIVLYYFGTQEIKGFAVTLGVGVVTTLFTAVFVSRVIFTVLVDHLGWRRASQLPMAVPFVQRALTWNVDWMRWRWVTLGALTLFLVAGGLIWWQRGDKLLDTEFLGGSQVELQFRTDEATGHPITMPRKDVQDRVRAIAASASGPADPVRVLTEAEVLPVNAPDGITSDHFRINMGVTDKNAVLAALINGFKDVVDSRPALEFAGSAETDWHKAPVFPVVGKSLGQNINRSQHGDDVTAFQGGVAIVLDGITPAASRVSIVERLDQMRRRSEFSDTLSRKRQFIVLSGTDQEVSSAVILVRDDVVNLFQNEEAWGSELAAREWALVTDALTHTTQLAGIQSFEPTIAAAFKAQAVVSIALSILLLTIYVWIRFGAGRWAIAATVPLFADVLGIVGLIAVAQMLYESPATNGFAVAVGLLPFKINLDQIAALLTITGYSLNDKIIIMDRIRENKGKLSYASYKVINDSINQTLSRTFITAGTTLISTIILYIFGGEAVRGFAYAFTLGVLIGTYTSIVSSPLVWSRKSEAGAVTPPRRSAQAPALEPVT